MYNKSTGAPANILGDPVAEQNLINYLKLGTYSGVVITHFEDIYKDNLALNTYTQLASLIASLHNAGIPVVIGQYRSDDDKRKPVNSKLDMDDYLSGIINYNQTTFISLPKGIFDGILLDYEFWQSDYGQSAVNSFAQVNAGWKIYKTLCTEIKTAVNNPLNHFRYTAAWIGRVLDPSEAIWDVNDDGTNGGAGDTHQAVINQIDSYQFDRIVLAFFLTDFINPLNYSVYDDPSKFLKRDQNAPANQQEIKWFMRLWYFSNNNYNTNIIPNFHAGFGNLALQTAPKLQHYLLGTTGTYFANNPSYLPDAEKEFVNEFYDPTIFSHYTGTGPSWSWNSINLRQGFEWFRFEIGVLDFANLSSRPNDSKHHFYIECSSPFKQSLQIELSNKTAKQANQIKIKVSPQPTVNLAIITISN